jgi:hypothetical protein
MKTRKKRHFVTVTAHDHIEMRRARRALDTPEKLLKAAVVRAAARELFAEIPSTTTAITAMLACLPNAAVHAWAKNFIAAS